MPTGESAKKNEPAAVAASRVVRDGLTRLWHLLGRAAKRRADAPELVKVLHGLRVTSRRAAVTLRAFQRLFDEVQLDRMRDMVREIRKAADKARDLDVLTESFTKGAAGLGDNNGCTSAVLARLRRERMEAQQPIKDLHRGLAAAKFPVLADDLSSSFKKSKQDGARKPFQQFAECCLKRPRKKFFQAAAEDLSRDAALHQLRICAKKLRYTLELATPAF